MEPYKGDNPNYRDRRGQPRYKPAPNPSRTLRSEDKSPAEVQDDHVPVPASPFSGSQTHRPGSADVNTATTSVKASSTSSSSLTSTALPRSTASPQPRSLQRSAQTNALLRHRAARRFSNASPQLKSLTSLDAAERQAEDQRRRLADKSPSIASPEPENPLHSAQLQPLIRQPEEQRAVTFSIQQESLTSLDTLERRLGDQNRRLSDVCGGTGTPQREITTHIQQSLPDTVHTAEGQSKMASPFESSVPTKRTFEEDHHPAVSSPLNPDFGQPQRTARPKKESLKKRESKAGPIPTQGVVPDPKETSDAGTILPQRFKIPQLPSDFLAPKGPALLPSGQTIMRSDGEEVELYSTSDFVHTKKKFRYPACIADPLFKSHQYRQTETGPLNARFSFSDSSEDILFDRTGTIATTSKGWRTARANVCVREGRYFYECKILKGRTKVESDAAQQGQFYTGPAVRMGWQRREAAIDMSCGYDSYSYALRDAGGQKVWIARPRPFFPEGEEILEGDTIGLEIYLPSLPFHKKIVTGNYNPAVDLTDDAATTSGTEAVDVVRDRIPVRYKGDIYFEHVDYAPDNFLNQLKFPKPIRAQDSNDVSIEALVATLSPTNPNPAQRTLPGSYIRAYKNGVDMGIAHENLLAFLPPASKPEPHAMARAGLDDGMLGYYPCVSMLRGSAVQFNFGPNFEFPPPGLDDNQDEVDMVGSDQQPVQNSSDFRSVAERFDEQVAEDIVFDIIDEVTQGIEDLKSGTPEMTGSLLPAGHAVPGLGLSSNTASRMGGIKQLGQEDDDE